MARILVLSMANAVADGARRVTGAEVDVRRVPETMDAERFA